MDIFKFFQNLLFPKTVDSIVAGINKIVGDLDDLVLDREVEKAEIDQQIVDLVIEQDELKGEINRAKAVKAKFANLLQ